MKKCSKCPNEYPLTEEYFYKHPTSEDGFFDKCKTCTIKATQANKATNSERVREYDKIKAKRPHRKEQHLAYVKRYQEKYPERVVAVRRLTTAVKNGTIKRPIACPKCRAEGRRIEAHFKDYSKPLDVDWLCSTCHRKNDHKHSHI